MRRALSINKLANGTLILDGHKPVKCFHENLDVDVYTFSAPRLGNWFLMREYNKKMPASFNPVFGLDAVPLVAFIDDNFIIGHQHAALRLSGLLERRMSTRLRFRL